MRRIEIRSGLGLLWSAVALTAWVGVACSPGGGEEAEAVPTIEAHAGEVSVSLAVPEGALPEGVEIDDVNITVGLGTTDEVSQADGEQVSLTTVAIDLQPSGLAFTEPVALDVSLPVGATGAVTALLESDDGIEALDVTAFSAEAADDGERTAVRVMVPHFSNLLITATDLRVAARVLEGLPERALAIGDEFTVRVMVDRPDIEIESQRDGAQIFFRDSESGEMDDYTAIVRPFRVRPDSDGSWQLMWGWVSSGFGFDLDPLVIEAVEPPIGVTTTSSVRRIDAGAAALITQSFVCRETGDFTVGFVGSHTQPVIVSSAAAATGVELARAGGQATIAIEPIALSGRCGEPFVLEPTSTPSPTAESTDAPSTATAVATSGAPGSSGETVSTVLMVVIDGSYYPASQFVVKAAGAPEPGHECSRPHYHASDGDEAAYGLAGSGSAGIDILGDPAPSACGFGLYDDFERINLPLTQEQLDALFVWLDPPL